MSDDSAAHWQRTYGERDAEELSWTEALPETSLAMTGAAASAPGAAILDIGGGASGLAGELLRSGYTDVSVADISAAALKRAQAELGEEARRVRWGEADARKHDFGRRFDLWHDRAVFHFMVEPADRDGYLASLRRSLHPGGHLVLAAFGPEGPTKCSGLPVCRYDAAAISRALDSDYELLSSQLKDHRTPSGRHQEFLYAHLRRRP